MHCFQDNEKRSWDIAIHGAAAKKVRARTGVDLYRLVDDGLKKFQDFMGDVILFIDTLYVLCEEQATSRKLTDEDFGRAMGGDALERAADAFTEELIDFFPGAKARQSLREIMLKGKEVGSILMNRLGNQIDKLNPEAEAEKIIKRFDESAGTGPKPSDFATISPESLESTPAHSLSAS